MTDFGERSFLDVKTTTPNATVARTATANRSEDFFTAH